MYKAWRSDTRSLCRLNAADLPSNEALQVPEVPAFSPSRRHASKVRPNKLPRSERNVIGHNLLSSWIPFIGGGSRFGSSRLSLKSTWGSET